VTLTSPWLSTVPVPALLPNPAPDRFTDPVLTSLLPVLIWNCDGGEVGPLPMKLTLPLIVSVCELITAGLSPVPSGPVTAPTPDTVRSASMPPPDQVSVSVTVNGPS